MIEFLWIGILFTLAMLAAAHYVWVVPQRQRAQLLARRMAELRVQARRTGLELARRPSAASLGFLDSLLRGAGLLQRLQEKIDQANLKYRAGNVAVLCAALLAATFLAAGLAGLPLPLLRLLLAGLASSLPVLYVLWKRRQRLKQFEAALPDAIDLFTRAMRAGHNIHSGLEVIANETYDPVRMEFRKLMEEIALGSQVDAALRNLAARVPLVDLHFFVTGVVLQRQTGANIVGVLENLALVIRERLNMAAKLRAHTAQQRLSAVVMILAPVVTGLAFYAIRPDYISVLWTDTVGSLFFTYAVVSELLGAFVLWRIASVRF